MSPIQLARLINFPKYKVEVKINTEIKKKKSIDSLVSKKGKKQICKQGHLRGFKIALRILGSAVVNHV